MFIIARKSSLNHQMWQQLEKKKCMGKSRHEAKLQAKEQGKKVDGIYSYKTYDAYKQSSKIFIKWIKTEYPEIKNISDNVKQNFKCKYN